MASRVKCSWGMRTYHSSRPAYLKRAARPFGNLPKQPSEPQKQPWAQALLPVQGKSHGPSLPYYPASAPTHHPHVDGGWAAANRADMGPRQEHRGSSNNSFTSGHQDCLSAPPQPLPRRGNFLRTSPPPPETPKRTRGQEGERETSG